MKNKCKRCEYEWISRLKTRIIACPRCKSYYWDKKRKQRKRKSV